MEEDMDDFGDIYADVEGSANAGVSMIPSIRQLYLEDQARAELSPVGDDGSEDEERMLYDRIGRDGQLEGRAASEAAAVAASEGSDEKLPEGSGDGGGDVPVEDSNDSDSEDDLRIVLNEEDCKRFGAPQRVGLGNGALLAGACTNEDEDDESMAGTGVDHPSKDHKWPEVSQMLVEGLEQSGQERCGTLRGGFATPYSQFKYVRSQSAGCPSNAKSTGQGYVVPFSVPMTSRGDWDVTGSMAAASCYIGFPVPRKRTIFDISVESFDLKPWRNQGVDITDFFNFGLNEESWKQYCDDMVLFKKKATWMSKNTIYESIRQIQASDSGFIHAATSAEASLTEVSCLERGRSGAQIVEKPKGKAIQVEGGSGERPPSVDIRRPRYQDSDVVIQIPMEVFDNDAASLPKGKPERFPDFLPHSDNGHHRGPYKTELVHNLSTPCHDGPKNEAASNCNNKEDLESRGTILIEHEEELQSPPNCRATVEKQRKMDVQVLGTSHELPDEGLHSSCPSSPENISEASKDDFSVDKLQSSAKRSSLGSVTGSDISVGSSSDQSHAEGVNNSANLQDPTLYLEKQRCRSETELCGVLVEDDNDSTDFDKKFKHNSDSYRRYQERLGKRSNFNYRGEHPSSLEGTRLSKGRESWKSTRKPKHPSVTYPSEHRRRSDLDPSSSGSCHWRHKHLEKRDSRQNDVTQNEYNIPKRYQHGWEMEFANHKEECRHSNPDFIPFCMEKGWSVMHKSKTADDRRWCVKPDVIFDNRYMKKHIVGSNSKQFPGSDRNESTRDEFDRHAHHRVWDKRRSLQRMERYDRNLCIEMDDSQGYVEDDGELWRYSHLRFLDDQTFRDSRSINGRALREPSPPRIYRHDSRRSIESCDGHCGISGARNARFYKHRDWDLPDPCADSYFSSSRDQREIDSGRYGIEERGDCAQSTLFSEGMKSSRVSQLRHLTEDQVKLGHQVLDDSHFPEECFSYERIYRDEHSRDHSFVNENGTRVPRETNFIAKEQRYVRHRKAVNERLNGYEGKFLGRYDEVAYKKIRDGKIENFDHTNEICWRKEYPGKRLKMKDNNTQVIRSTVEKVKQCDSEKCATGPNEVSEEPELSHDQDISGLEEGQLVEPDDEDAGTLSKNWDTTESVPISSTEVNHTHGEKITNVRETSNRKKSIEYDNSHILETLARMEKRRERFREPIAPKKEQANALETHSQAMELTDEVKQERPARKRRWGAVKNSTS